MSNELAKQAVSFDIWKTLIKSNPEYKPARDKHVAKQLGVETGLVKTALRQADVVCDEKTDKTGIQLGGTERLEAMCKILGAPIARAALSEIADEIQELFLEYPLQLMEPELLSTLDDIHPNRAIALTSNTGFFDGTYMRRALDAVGIGERTDHYIFSNEVGVAKPDPKIFTEAAALLGVAPSAITHVGDNFVADYQGATRAGMQAVHLAPEPVEVGVATTETIKEAYEKGLL